MKVGIVTLPLVANYGCILQNYALQQVLKGMGHNPITFDYLPSLSMWRYILYVGKGLICVPFPSLRHRIKPYKHYLERPPRIDSFVRNHITITKTIPNYTNRLLKKNKIEAILLGSDQVWRYKYNSHYWEDMFLAFAKNYHCKKVAYAASFGLEKWDCPEGMRAEPRELLKQFDAISIREETGVVICKRELGIEAVSVIDPTLLLRLSDYEQLCSMTNAESSPFLAAYVLDMNEEKASFIETIAKTKGLAIKMMTISKSGIPVEDWLSTIKNASYVITDSYHGSLFSIIFEKQFLTFINKKRGASRFTALFSQLGLMNRLIDDVLETIISTEETIDYLSVNYRLEQLRKDSLSFLIKALS